jgi:hypothetical protein
VQKAEREAALFLGTATDRMRLSIFKPAVHLLLVAWATRVAADFQLYKLYSQDALIAGLALSDKCLEAL